MDSSLLHAHDLTREYGGGGMRGLNLAIPAGSIVGVAGPNGAGKSTALGLLATRIRPQSGSLRVDATDAANKPGAARRRIGYLAHRPPLYDDMRVAAFLAYAARLYGVPSRHTDASISRALERTGLVGMSKHRIRHLSHGYRQRVGLAQALIHDPAVLILDEPTAGLDTDAAAALLAHLAPLAEGRAIVLASHLFAELDRLCHRLAIIRSGQMVADHHLGDGDASIDTLVIRLRDTNGEAPSPEALGLNSVEALGADRLRVRNADDTVRRRLMATVLERGWTLDEWLPPRGLAERLYREAIEEPAC